MLEMEIIQVLVFQRTDDSHYLVVDNATTHLDFELTRTKQINLRGAVFVGGTVA